MIFAALIPEDYRANSASSFPIAIPGKGVLTSALFVPTQDIRIGTDVEAFLRIIAKRPGTSTPVAYLTFSRGKYYADQVLSFKLNTAACTFEGGETLHLYKEISQGVLALPESLVQIECR